MKEKIEKAREILKSSDIPTLPQELFLLQEEVSKKYPNTRVIGGIIKKSPDIYSELLKHSKRMLPDDCSNKEDIYFIINSIGLDSIVNTFLVSFLTKELSITDFDKKVLAISINTAIAASILSEDLYEISRTDAYLASIIHEIGSIFLMRKDAEYEKFFNRSLTNPTQISGDIIGKYGTDNRYISSLLSSHWKLKPHISKAILLMYRNSEVADFPENERYILRLSRLIEASRFITSVNIGNNYVSGEVKKIGGKAFTDLSITNTCKSRANYMVKKFGVKASELTLALPTSS